MQLEKNRHLIQNIIQFKNVKILRIQQSARIKRSRWILFLFFEEHILKNIKEDIRYIFMLGIFGGHKIKRRLLYTNKKLQKIL